MIFDAGGDEGRNLAVACIGEPACKISPHDSHVEIEI